MASSVLLSHKYEMPSMNGFQENPLVGNNYTIQDNDCKGVLWTMRALPEVNRCSVLQGGGDVQSYIFGKSWVKILDYRTYLVL